MSVTTTYENIAMIVGIEAAQIIVSEFGGTELYIPHVDNLKNDHKLIGSLGIDTAKRLCRYWHGQVLNVPLNKKAEIVKRNQQIIALAKSGECPNRLATKFTLHVRTIRKIIEKDIRDRARCMLEISLACLID